MSTSERVFLVLLVLISTSFSFILLSSKNVFGQEDPPGPVISNINVSASDTSATITWTTDEPATSSVDWGVTPVNDFTVNDFTLVTSHSVTISSLLPSTLYYFAIFTSDAANNETISNSTFTTSSTASSTPSSSSTSTPTSPTPTPVPKDTIPPTLTLSTNLSKGYEVSPVISGTVSDNGSVGSVEFSTNTGVSWAPANLKGKGEINATFSFSLGVLDDGNYIFLVRAKDSAGNVTDAKSYTLIIDRLPPQVGTTIISAGPQIIPLTKEGAVLTTAGLEQKVTLSAVGGPTSLEVSTGEEKFNFEKNLESGLWSGKIKFSNPGIYELTTKSVDGAKNETEQALAKVAVVPAGKVTYFGKSVSGAEVSVYVFEPTLGQYILWDGASYGQSNPQKTDEEGKYSLLLPAGKYYIEVQITPLIKLRSQIFELGSASPVNAYFAASRALPIFPNEVQIVPVRDVPRLDEPRTLVNTPFPFELLKEAEGVSVISFLATWHPAISPQIQVLEDLQDEVKSAAVTIQESEPVTNIFQKRGKYKVKMLSDPDGKLVEPLFLRFLPVHFFLTNDGKIKSVAYGILGKDEIMERLK